MPVDSSTGTSLEALAALPFPAQIEQIDAQLAGLLAEGRSPAALFSLLASFPDHEPLAHGLRYLIHEGVDQLLTPATREALCDVLHGLPDTGVRRILRGLERMIVPPAVLAELGELVLDVMTRWEIERIAVICLVDRWLKNTAPERRRAWRDASLHQLRHQLKAGQIEAMTDVQLLQLPGKQLADFATLADEAGCREAWEARLAAFAETVLALMRESPRSLSQANAEELLSRRVYTDPGHFLIELFQNAEDAQASLFDVAIEERQVAIRHDGVPFDAKDVVGVLSIGQTTKAREQIGFFGVGFKSVYEICERPQIYSDLFCFEIADVSIPRDLDAHPERGVGETLLLLPYRPILESDDGEMSAHQAEAASQSASAAESSALIDEPVASLSADERARLYARALAVPPETLLTLQHLQTFVVSCDGQRRTVQRHATETPHIVELQLQETQERRLYRVASGRYAYDGPQRELSRAMETGMLLAIAIDEEGHPQPLSGERPTLFSHLPTDERSGLRFLLHAHFELPVDRERLDLSSPWNRWALAKAGELLAEAVAQLCEEVASATPLSRQTLDGLLAIVPLASELPHAAYRGLLDAFGARAATLPLLAGADGTSWLTPAQARTTELEELRNALAGIELDDHGVQLCRRLERRERQVALALGTVPLRAEELVALLARHLETLADGDPWPTAWLRAHHPAILDGLGTLLHAPPPRRRASREPAAQAHVEQGVAALYERLSALALLPDQQGLPRRPGALWRAEPALRRLYGPHRAFLHESLAFSPSDGQKRLLDGLAIPQLTAAQLLVDLEDPAMASALLAHAGALGLHRYLARLDEESTSHLGLLPLFPVKGGGADEGQPPRYAPIDAGPGERGWLIPDEAFLAWLDGLGDVCPPLIMPALCEALTPYLRRLGGRVLDLSAMLSLLDEGLLPLEALEEHMMALHHYLEAGSGEWSQRQRQQLASSPLFFDHGGNLRALVGEGCAYVPLDEDVLAFAPDAPWLATSLRAMSYIKGLPIPLIGVREIVKLLCDGASGTLFSPDSPEALRRAYRYLLRQREELLPRERHALEEAPIWLDQDGQRRRLRELQRPSDDADLTALFAAFEARYAIEDDRHTVPSVPSLDEDGPEATSGSMAGQHDGGMTEAAGPSAFALVEGLGLEASLMQPDLELLVTRLPSWDADWSEDHELWQRLRSALLRAVEALAQTKPKRLASLLDLPLFATRDGLRLSVGRWHELPEAAGVDGRMGRAFRAQGALADALAYGSASLLTAEEDEGWASLWTSQAVACADVLVLIDALEHDPQLRDHPEAAAAARRALVALRHELPSRSEGGHDGDGLLARLSALPIWPAQGGGLMPASELLVPGELQQRLGEALTSFLIGHDDEGALTLAEEAWPEAQALAAHVAFAAPVEQLLHQLGEMLAPGASIASQPPPFDQLGSLLDAAALLCEDGDPTTALSLPLSLDVDSRLRRGPLWRLDGDGLALARRLGMSDQVASPVWVEDAVAIAPGLVREMPPERLLRAIMQLARDTDGGVDAHDSETANLDDVCGDMVFFRWLDDHLEPLMADPQLHGALGNAPLLKTAAGTYRAPRSMLWVVSASLAEGLQLDEWRCHDDIPEDLRQALQAQYQLEDAALSKLVGVLAEAHLAAQSQEDGPRSMAILQAIAEALPLSDEDADGALAEPDEDDGASREQRQRRGGKRSKGDARDERAERIERLARRHKLARLRVETTDGDFERIGRLIFPAPSHQPLLDNVLEAPLRQIHERYDVPALRRFFAALGAPSHPPIPQLKALLQGEGRRDSLEAQLDLARYLAMLIDEVPALRSRLPLETSAWVPDGTGTPHPPGELYWPSPEVQALVGASPLRCPHPSFFRTVPPEIAEALPFRHAEDARLDDVLAHLHATAGEVGASFELLSWLEQRLRGKLISSEAVCEAFTVAPYLRDDDGVLQLPSAIICTPGERWIGDRRSTWSDGLRFSKLASILGVPHRVGPAEVFAYGREIAARCDESGAEALLREEPALHERLPRCLALLGERKAPTAAAMPVLVEAADGQRTILAASSPEIALPSPPWLVPVARQQGLAVAFPILPAGEEDAALAWLRSCGIAGLDQLMAPEDATEQAASPSLIDAAGTSPSSWRSGAEQADWPDLAPARASAVAKRTQDVGLEPSRVTDDVEDHGDPGLWSRFKRWWGDESDEPTERTSARKNAQPLEPSEPRPRSRADSPQRREPRETAVSVPSMPGVTGRGRGGPSRPQPEVHGRWFRSRSHVESQLQSNSDGGGRRWLEDREDAPFFGFGFAPSPLPFPQVYAPQLIAERFQRQSQRWDTAGMPRWWRQEAEEGGFQIALEGELPAGENLFPLPLYGRLSEVHGEGIKVIQANNGQVFLMTREPTALSCVVTLDRAPDFEGYEDIQYEEESGDLPEALWRPVVPDDELPSEVLDWVELQLDQPSLPLVRALAVRRFIQESYQYDPSYIEDPAIAEWLSRVTRGRTHVHIAALHAGRDGHHLGRGVCYELGALACELLRRLGIPAAVSTGWTWESGQLAEPDHMWAMALLPSDVGLRWLPIDPSTTREGRPLRVGQRPSAGWQVTPPRQQERRPEEPSWGRRDRTMQPPREQRDPDNRDEQRDQGARRHSPPHQRRERPRSSGSSRRGASPAAPSRGEAPPTPARLHNRKPRKPPVAELMRVIRHMQRLAGETPESGADLQARCEAMLEDPHAARQLQKLLDKM